MADVPSFPRRIQIEEVRFRSPVSESVAQKLGGTMNYILDRYIIPPGFVAMYGGLEASLPSGWIICDGRAIDRTVYNLLYLAIGTLHGVGNGSTTFNVPDLRGLFVRGVNNTTIGTGGYPNANVGRTITGTGTTLDPGSTQGSSVEAHRHAFGGNTGSGDHPSHGPTFAGPPHTGATGLNDGVETRPANYYLHYIIHW
jgi:hypothetical protein